jgi:branched-chain amino acid transport system permease protein
MKSVNVNILIAIPLAMLFSVGLAAVVEFTLIEKIRHDHMLTLVLTFGLGIVAEQVLLLIFGGYYLSLPGLYGSITFGELSFSQQRVFIGISAILITIALSLFLKKTKIGTAIRMVSQNPELAILVGVDAKKIAIITFSISALLASSAGALLGPEFSLYPTAGWGILFITFVVVIVGGLGSVNGTLMAGVLIGLTESLTAYYISPALKTISMCIILIIILLIRPSGVAGKVAQKV